MRRKRESLRQPLITVNGVIFTVMAVPKELDGVTAGNPEILGGTLCFSGTRVPVETFLDYIGTGYSLERFLKGFPSVSKEQTLLVLEWEATQAKLAIGLELAS